MLETMFIVAQGVTFATMMIGPLGLLIYLAVAGLRRNRTAG
jgi:hypothetical protein